MQREADEESRQIRNRPQSAREAADNRRIELAVRAMTNATSVHAFSRRRPVRMVLLTASSAGALALFLAVGRPARLWASLGSLPPTAVLVAVVATIGGVLLGAARWRSLLAASGVEAPAAKAFAALTIGSAVNNLVPARGGDVVRIESARQLTGAPRLTIAGTIVSERILDGFVLGLLVVTGALLDGIGGALVWAGAAVAGATIGVAIVIPRILRGRLAGLRSGLAVFRVPHAIAPALATTAAIWLADVVMYGALAHGLHLRLSIGATLLLVGVGNLALAIPSAAAGLGSFELVTLAGAHSIGAHGPTLAAFVLAVHAVIVLPPTVVGAVLARVALPRAFRTTSEREDVLKLDAGALVRERPELAPARVRVAGLLPPASVLRRRVFARTNTRALQSIPPSAGVVGLACAEFEWARIQPHTQSCLAACEHAAA